MATKEKNNEQLILAAAEEEFLERGYANAKTTEIARRAGVTHAMLHYYYRTKENLFEMVFQSKVDLFIHTLLFPFNQDLPFMEKLRRGIENHYDMIAANPRLPYFIFSEVLTNEDRKRRFIKVLRPRATLLLERIGKELKEEVDKGNLCSIHPVDLMLDILSLNVFGFVVQPIVEGLLDFNEKQRAALLQHRKESNVELILGRLRKR